MEYVFVVISGIYGEGNGTPLQYSCLENPMDGGAWWAAVHGVARSWTRLSDFTFTLCTGEGNGNPLQCSCLETPRDGRAGWAAVDGVAQSRTRLNRLSSSSSNIPDHHTCIKAVRISPQSTCCAICLHFITVTPAIPELWDSLAERWSGTWHWGSNTMLQIIVFHVLRSNCLLNHAQSPDRDCKHLILNM